MLSAPLGFTLDIVNNASSQSLIFGVSSPTGFLNRWKPHASSPIN